MLISVVNYTTFNVRKLIKLFLHQSITHFRSLCWSFPSKHLVNIFRVQIILYFWDIFWFYFFLRHL